MIGGFATDDVIIGSVLKDNINGNGGNDVVRGGAGSDTLSGGGGDDIVSYAGSALGVTINLATDSASGGDASGDTIQGFEGVTGGNGSDVLTGDDDDNAISGSAGNDSIFGGLGADVLNGGSGNDTFTYVAEEELTGIETVNGGAGTLDSIIIGGAVPDDLDFTSATVSGIERLVFQIDSSVHFQGSVFGTGAGQINSVTGSAGDITLFLTGKDTDLTGVTFTNWQSPLFYAANGDLIVLAGGGADDVLTGSSQSDVLYGILGSDTLSGGGGSDYLMGSLGQDFMTGGADADIFFFDSVSDSAVGVSRDRILDFDQGSDIIALEGIDAIAGGNDDSFQFIETAAFQSGQAGKLRYFQTGSGNTVIEGEVNGDGNADFQIQFTGLVNFAGADFSL